jgi:hypothetical protein
MPDAPEPKPEDVEAAAEVAAEVDNDDPQTRREAVEQELMDEGLSEAGSHVGDEMP